MINKFVNELSFLNSMFSLFTPMAGFRVTWKLTAYQAEHGSDLIFGIMAWRIRSESNRIAGQLVRQAGRHKVIRKEFICSLLCLFIYLFLLFICCYHTATDTEEKFNAPR